MSNQPDSTDSHPLLDTLHATWLDEEKTRWLDREVITQEEYNVIPSRVGYIRKLIPETRNSASARRYRDVCIIPSGQRIPTLLIEAGIRQDKNAMLDNIQLCFRTFEGKLPKAIFFIWEFFPDYRVSLDLEVYGYDAGQQVQVLLQTIRVIPTQHESNGYVELPVSFREIFGARLPEDIPVAGNVRVSLQDLRNTAEETLLSSELEPANIEDCLPEPVNEQPKLHELPTNDPRPGNQPEGTSGSAGEAKIPIPETMIDYLMRYVNGTRHLDALFPADDPRLEDLARNAYKTMPGTLEKLGLDPESTGPLMDTAIYDVAIFGDDSGSMRQSGRYDALSEIARRFIPIAADISQSGVSVRFINSKVDGKLDNICEASEIEHIFDTIRPGGFTPIGTRLKEKIINPFLEDLRSPNAEPMKPKLVVIITDGEPSKEPESALKDAIIDCKNSLNEIKNRNGKPYGASSIVFCLSIVGNSADADKYVREIADDPEVNEMVYCDLDPLDKQISTKTPNLNLVKLLQAAIDKA